mmetsp:Transcript_52555/g.148942  ORF Transcript_52555/g.148942 Transcript_52555/m.148942 type:complete len:252 (+) Transcript_52555:133-888(+)
MLRTQSRNTEATGKHVSASHPAVKVHYSCGLRVGQNSNHLTLSNQTDNPSRASCTLPNRKARSRRERNSTFSWLSLPTNFSLSRCNISSVSINSRSRRWISWAFFNMRASSPCSFNRSWSSKFSSAWSLRSASVRRASNNSSSVSTLTSASASRELMARAAISCNFELSSSNFASDLNSSAAVFSSSSSALNAAPMRSSACCQSSPRLVPTCGSWANADAEPPNSVANSSSPAATDRRPRALSPLVSTKVC